MYRSKREQRWNIQNIREYAIAEARRAGAEIGAEIGRLETLRDIAFRLKKMKMPLQEIAVVTKLSVRDISAL